MLLIQLNNSNHTDSFPQINHSYISQARKRFSFHNDNKKAVTVPWCFYCETFSCFICYVNIWLNIKLNEKSKHLTAFLTALGHVFTLTSERSNFDSVVQLQTTSSGTTWPEQKHLTDTLFQRFGLRKVCLVFLLELSHACIFSYQHSACLHKNNIYNTKLIPFPPPKEEETLQLYIRYVLWTLRPHKALNCVAVEQFFNTSRNIILRCIFINDIHLIIQEMSLLFFPPHPWPCLAVATSGDVFEKPDRSNLQRRSLKAQET